MENNNNNNTAQSNSLNYVLNNYPFIIPNLNNLLLLLRDNTNLNPYLYNIPNFIYPQFPIGLFPGNIQPPYFNLNTQNTFPFYYNIDYNNIFQFNFPNQDKNIFQRQNIHNQQNNYFLNRKTLNININDKEITKINNNKRKIDELPISKKDFVLNSDINDENKKNDNIINNDKLISENENLENKNEPKDMKENLIIQIYYMIHFQNKQEEKRNLK